MIRKSTFSALLALTLALVMCSGAAAQWTQQKACPGWSNPANFNAWTNGQLGSGGYSGSGGTKNGSSGCPNVTTGATGTSSLSPAYTAAQMNSVEAASCNYPSLAIPDQTRQFAIMTNTTATDPNTAGHLKYVPTQFNYIDTTGRPSTQINTSIRIGDGCAAGGNYGVALLNYQMRVTSQNAMLFLYYAIVAQAPTHGQEGNPTFIIRVMRRDNTGTWKQISDTLAYFISGTPSSNTSYPCPPMEYANILNDFNANGWHHVDVSGISSGGSIYYKDWDKVAINLSKYIYDTVQIQALIYDCEANYHFAYAYIAGECREMDLKATGCPPGLSTEVATISAPRGMKRYEWSASEYGVSDPTSDLNAGMPNDYFTFRNLRMPAGTPMAGQFAAGPEDTVIVRNGHRDTLHFYDYKVQADDYRVLYRPNINKVRYIDASPDSMGNRQTFRCRMTSALDPSKPFKTDLYLNVQNFKPSMRIDSLSRCDGTVRLWNQSSVPGAPNAVDLSTTSWMIYNNSQAVGVPDTVMTGDSATYFAPNTDMHYVLVRTENSGDPTCYSEAIYPIKALETPNTGMTVYPRVLCDSAMTTITDTTDGVERRMWRFLKPQYNGPLTGLNFDEMEGMLDTIEGYLNDSVTVVRSFTHPIEPIELIVWNGLKYRDRATGQMVPCANRAYDTVAVFVHPELQITGDTIVCEGSRTNAVVSTVGVENCSYQWSMTNGYVSGGIPAGATLREIPYAPVSKYYIMVTSPQGCVAWDSAYAYYVQPRMEMYPPDGRICPGDTVVLIGSMADHYSWRVGSSTVATGDTVFVSPNSSTTYTMIGHGANDCDALPLTERVTVIPFPAPKVDLSPKYVDSEDPTVVLTNVSSNAATTSWLFSDGERVDQKSVKHTFEEAKTGQDSVVNVELTTANVLGCVTVYPFTIPVHLFTAWLPTVFTPGSEDVNAKFKLFTINEYEYFHIYVYNREGMLVFESEDPAFEWDGTHNGTACPQGAYVYVCNYRKPHVGTLSSRKGTVTLLR